MRGADGAMQAPRGKMDELVKRVTVIQRSGEGRRAEVIYEKVGEDDAEQKPGFASWLSDTPRAFMRAGGEIARGASRLLPFELPKLDGLSRIGPFRIPPIGPFATKRSPENKRNR
jgi:hypothetical protein